MAGPGHNLSQDSMQSTMKPYFHTPPCWQLLLIEMVVSAKKSRALAGTDMEQGKWELRLIKMFWGKLRLSREEMKFFWYLEPSLCMNALGIPQSTFSTTVPLTFGLSISLLWRGAGHVGCLAASPVSSHHTPVAPPPPTV